MITENFKIATDQAKQMQYARQMRYANYVRRDSSKTAGASTNKVTENYWHYKVKLRQRIHHWSPHQEHKTASDATENKTTTTAVNQSCKHDIIIVMHQMVIS